MITVNHLTKRYGSHLAVDDISFTVQDGEIVGFLGPNGAGKSTTALPPEKLRLTTSTFWTIPSRQNGKSATCRNCHHSIRK